MKKLGFILLIIFLWGCKQEYVKNPQALPTLKKAKVVEVEETQEPLPLYGSGRIEAHENVKLSFKTGGIIQELLVDQGQAVSKGQLLGRLNLSEINAQVTQAEANVKKLERDLSRFQRLLKDSAATLQSVQDIETGWEVAKANLTIARFNQVHSRIVAPANGIIQQKLVEENELVTPGQPVFSLRTKEGGMRLVLGLSDRDVVKVRMGDRARIRLDAYPGTEAEAFITEIAVEGHPRTGTFAVELSLQQFPYELKSGFFAKARILPSQQKPYFKVPMRAIVEGKEDQVAIFVPESNRTKKLVLKPDYFGDDFFSVSSQGFDTNTLNIITEGAAYLREGETFEGL